MVAKRPGGADVSGESRGEPALWGGAERAEGTAGGGGVLGNLGLKPPALLISGRTLSERVRECTSRRLLSAVVIFLFPSVES